MDTQQSHKVLPILHFLAFVVYPASFPVGFRGLKSEQSLEEKDQCSEKP